MIEAIVYARLTANTSLATALSGRIYPAIPEENIPALPHLVYNCSLSQSIQTLEGMAGLEQYSVDVTVYHRDWQLALSLAAQVKESMNGWRSSGKVGPVLSSTLQSSALVAESGAATQTYQLWINEYLTPEYVLDFSIPDNSQYLLLI
ncbi:tail completion protein gp17 [Limnoglobus roseus]|uniref:Uncharacterized protein n=1 Tax=Limnoglobus roseus TaxID=2598579 RepID=A0A5C1AEZ4_9BACT|nr:DUF3168 domain-containing protein [Limnoglobus roseus]QEL16536.1 hypothetical protein PX52LOC_03495 [Limnoglobus roseus]